MEKCNPQTIVKGKHFCVSKCAQCHRIGLYYKNMLVGFSIKNFSSFHSYLIKVNFNENAVPTPDYKQKVVINTCHQDIQMVFDKDEFEELKDLTGQATLMLDAYALLQA